MENNNINNIANQETVVEETPTGIQKLKKATKSLVTRSAILVGILIVLIISMVLTVIYIPRGVNYLASVSLSSIFKPKETVKIDSNKLTAAPGEKIMLTWNSENLTDGAYTITYPCKDGIEVFFYNSNDRIVCDQPFYFVTPDNSAAVKILSSRNSSIDIPFYINFKNNDNKVSVVGDTLVTILPTGSAPVNGNAGVAVNNQSSSTTSTKTVSTSTNVVTNTSTTTKTNSSVSKTPTKNTVSFSTKTTYKSGIDLVVNLLEVGSVNSNNTFTPGITVPQGSRPAFRFEVTNKGSKASGSWNFKATLPSIIDPTFTSTAQPSLSSGDHLEFVLGFDITADGGMIVISVNDNRSVSESDFSNNTLTFRMSGDGKASSPISKTDLLNGKDLSVKITDSGYVSNGKFISSNTVSLNSRAGIKFIVTNNGNTATGEWQFKATIPSNLNGTYISNTLKSLDAGESTEITLAFDGLSKVGDNLISVQVDSSNSVNEVNENNNDASAIIKAI